MTNEQLSSVENIINESNIQILQDVDDLKEGLESVLENELAKQCSFYSGIKEFKIYGADDYLFGTSYEEDSHIRYFVAVTLNDNSLTSINSYIRPKKNKKKKSTRQQLMENISGISSKKVPYIQDFAQNLCMELKKYADIEKVASNNCTILFSVKNYVVEIIVCYELVEDVLTYLKGEKVYKLNPNNLYGNILSKKQQTSDNYLKMCKIFKALEKEVVYAGISDIYIAKKDGLVENLLYNVPSNLYEDDCNLCFLKTCTYLINCKDFKNFKTIDGYDMFDEVNYKIKVAKNLSRKIMYAYNNFDKIIEITSQNAVQDEQLATQEDIENNDDDILLEKSQQTSSYKDFKSKMNQDKNNNEDKSD